MASLENQKASLQRLSSNRWQRPVLSREPERLADDKPRKADEAYGKLKELILTQRSRSGWDARRRRHLMELLETGRTPLRERFSAWPMRTCFDSAPQELGDRSLDLRPSGAHQCS
ncbi:MAG: hypothetical protein R2849_05540 [Thermomicrobiales bacterium]